VCILMEDHVKFVACKLKERVAACWNQLQNIHMYQDKSSIRTWRWMKILLQDHCLASEEEEMPLSGGGRDGIRPPPVMRSYQSNKIAEQHQQPPIEEPST